MKDHGDSEEEANQNHDENLVRLVEQARKVNLRIKQQQNEKFIRSLQHETAFQEVQELFVRHPVLRYYNLQ